MVEEPLAKYVFIKKEKELKALYAGISGAMKQYTECYLERNEREMLKTLKKCYGVDWMAFKAPQPVGKCVWRAALTRCRCGARRRSSWCRWL